VLLFLKVDCLESLNLEEMEAGKEVDIRGVVTHMYFNDDYIRELEKKAQQYDEIDVVEAMKKYEKNNINRKYEDDCNDSFIGHDVKPRESL
jgi:hypothetical protein